MDLDGWVAQNEPASDLQVGVAFWEYIETLRRLARKFDVDEVQVRGSYTLVSPPPEQSLMLPIAALQTPLVTFFVKWDPGAWPNEWIVSVQRSAPYRGPLLGLLDPQSDLRSVRPDAMPAELLFPPYAESPARFSCELYDDWDVTALMRLVCWED